MQGQHAPRVCGRSSSFRMRYSPLVGHLISHSFGDNNNPGTRSLSLFWKREARNVPSGAFCCDVKGLRKDENGPVLCTFTQQSFEHNIGDWVSAWCTLQQHRSDSESKGPFEPFGLESPCLLRVYGSCLLRYNTRYCQGRRRADKGGIR